MVQEELGSILKETSVMTRIRGSSYDAICDLLMRLGITANYLGFLHTAYAVHLVLDNPLRLHAVTRMLYPEVARSFATTPQCVERNIRTVIRVARIKSLPLLTRLAKHSVYDGITGAEFISILAVTVRSGEKEEPMRS